MRKKPGQPDRAPSASVNGRGAGASADVASAAKPTVMALQKGRRSLMKTSALATPGRPQAAARKAAIKGRVVGHVFSYEPILE